MSRCASCSAEILWAVSTKTGKLMPVDPAPTRMGTLLITNRDGQAWATPLSKMAAPGPLHVSHFATCPNAASHRKEKKP